MPFFVMPELVLEREITRGATVFPRCLPSSRRVAFLRKERVAATRRVIVLLAATAQRCVARRTFFFSCSKRAEIRALHAHEKYDMFQPSFVYTLHQRAYISLSRFMYLYASLAACLRVREVTILIAGARIDNERARETAKERYLPLRRSLEIKTAALDLMYGLSRRVPCNTLRYTFVRQRAAFKQRPGCGPRNGRFIYGPFARTRARFLKLNEP